MVKFTATGEQPADPVIEPQIERHELLLKEGPITEPIEIDGAVPAGETWYCKVVIQIRKASAEEIARLGE